MFAYGSKLEKLYDWHANAGNRKPATGKESAGRKTNY